jgi:hypothetical protein
LAVSLDVKDILAIASMMGLASKDVISMCSIALLKKVDLL